MRFLALLIAVFFTFQNIEAGYRGLHQKRSFFEIFNTGSLGGFVDRQLSHDEFEIIYEGDDGADHWLSNVGFLEEKDRGRKTVYSYALRRAGEVALEHGFNYFSILAEDSNSEKTRSRHDGIGYVPVYTYTVAIIIKCHSGPVTNAYNAAEVANWRY